jgi:hypothetical protein
MESRTKTAVEAIAESASDANATSQSSAAMEATRGFWVMTAQGRVARFDVRKGRVLAGEVWDTGGACIPETVWRVDADRAVGLTRGLRLCAFDSASQQVSVMHDTAAKTLEGLGCFAESRSLSRSGTLVAWCNEPRTAWVARDVMNPDTEPTWARWEHPADVDFRYNFIFAGRDDVVYQSLSPRSPIRVVEFAAGSVARDVFVPKGEQVARVLDRTDTHVTLGVQEHVGSMRIHTFDLRGAETASPVVVRGPLPGLTSRTLVVDGLLIAVPEVQPWVDVIDLQAGGGERAWQRVDVDNSILAAW